MNPHNISTLVIIALALFAFVALVIGDDDDGRFS
jgi:hypothetical protein